jgi:hypothetical protein
MADVKISGLPASTLPLAGTEVLPLVQSGVTKKVASDDLTVKNVRSNATTGILQIAGPGVGTTRVMTTPNANFTAARTDAAQSFTGAQSFGNNVNLTDATAAKVNFATTSSATTNYIQTHSDGFSLMLYVDRGVSKPTYLMNFGGTHEWGFAGTSSVELDITNKNLKINTGNLVMGTAAKGIDFSINPNPAGATSELLNDYEEGTWTPNQGAGLTVIGTFSSFGTYTKIGRMVTVRGRFEITTKGSSTGVWRLGGLPFVGRGGIVVGGLFGDGFTFTAAQIGAAVLGAESSVTLIQETGGAGTSNWNYLFDTNQLGSGDKFFSVTYFTST